MIFIYAGWEVNKIPNIRFFKMVLIYKSFIICSWFALDVGILENIIAVVVCMSV